MSTFSDVGWSNQCGIEAFQYRQVDGSLVQARELLTEEAFDVDEKCEAARLSGIAEGEARARKTFEQMLNAERQALVATIREFARERQHYYQRVEAEIVQLALAIARKILHRESQVDPLLLAGVVQVALRNMAKHSAVRVRVHPDKAELWREHFNGLPRDDFSIDVVGDACVDKACCALETELGTSELGLEVQLKEIEKGLFDLLAQRPRDLL